MCPGDLSVIMKLNRCGPLCLRPPGPQKALGRPVHFATTSPARYPHSLTSHTPRRSCWTISDTELRGVILLILTHVAQCPPQGPTNSSDSPWQGMRHVLPGPLTLLTLGLLPRCAGNQLTTTAPPGKSQTQKRKSSDL